MFVRNSDFMFTSEAVSEGHPDKVCDQISDAVLDAALHVSPTAHVACESLATTDYVVLSGEVSPVMNLNYDQIVRKVVKDIGYDNPDEHFAASTLKLDVRIHGQSQDISRGVDSQTSIGKEQGAGDQGIMFGYACNETPEYMPAPLYYSREILKRLSVLRRNGQAPFLRPDSKSQLTFVYESGRPVAIKQIVVSHQHTDGAIPKVHEVVKQVLHEVLPENFLSHFDFSVVNGGGESPLLINPTGNFVIGGPDGDTGVTGRKIIVDTYGGMGRHGGGAFSGKDPSKVDRSAAYAARYAAKNIVAAGLADRCEIQFSYAIGVARPLSIYLNFFGTGRVSEKKVEEMLQSGEIIDFRPAHIIERLGLLKPQGWSYVQTAANGHFGHPEFPWERVDVADALKNALGR